MSEQTVENEMMKIVFIDDEPEVSESYQNNFSIEGYESIAFTSPAEAVEYINGHYNQIVMVFTDQNMPSIKGVELREKLVDDAKEIPIFMISGFVDKDLVETALKQGFLETIPKPLDPDRFLKLHEEHGKIRVEHLIEEREMIEHFLEETQPLVIEIEEIILDLDEGNDVENRLKDYFRILHTIKGTGACLGLKNIAAYVHKYEDFVGEIRDGKRELEPKVNALLLFAYDHVKEIFNFIKENGTDRTIDVDFYLAQLVSRIDQVGTGATNAGKPAVKDELAIIADITAKDAGGGKGVSGKDSMNVSLSLLDEFNELSGEVTVLRNSIMKSYKEIETKLPQNNDVALMGEMLDGMHKVIGSLQNKITEMRKIPLKNVFRQFKRVVRDVSKGAGKEAELVVKGDELRVDNQVGNLLSNTLVHLIRNSVDHGLERTEKRLEVGKDSKGKVEIEAVDAGESLKVFVKDDGGGIPREKIQKIAIERGMGTEEEFNRYSDSRIFGLIFEPGFSTAEVVTDISGRGVGMDMVKSSIEKAGGNIHVDSILGKGTTITLTIPYPKSVLIINSVLVNACEGNYLIPADDVVEVVRLEDKLLKRVEKINDKLYYRMNGDIYPIIPFEDVLGFQGIDFNLEERDTISLVKLKVGAFEYFVVVDEVLDLEEIVKKPLTRNVYESAFAFSGASVLGNGEVALILDAERIMINYLHETDQEKVKDDRDDDLMLDSESIVEYLGVDCDYGDNLLFELKDVFRLEKIKTGRIQQSGTKHLIKYRDEAVPLLFLDEFLGTDDFNIADTISNNEEFDTVMVMHNSRVYAVVVNSIKDILKSSEEIFSEIADQDKLLGVFYVENNVYNVLNVHEVIHFMNRKQNVARIVA